MTTKTIELLGTRLSEQQGTLEKLRKYHAGLLPVGFLASEVKTARPSLFNVVAAWPSLIVGAVEQRLDVEGFRLGEEVDSDLWTVWQANNLDEQSQLVHEAAMIYGRAFVSVWAGADGQPTIRPESPTQMICDRDPATGAVRSALKMWTDPAAKLGYATLYLPDRIERYQTRSTVPDGPPPLSATAWTLRADPVDNPLGIVPVVPFSNRPQLGALDGRSEFVDVLSLIDAASKLLTDLMISAEYASMPRRFATGVEIPIDDTTGEPVAAFSDIAGKLWLSEDPETKFGQFPEANLSGYIEAVELMMQQISSLTNTPPSYLNILKGQLVSADSARAAETGLVSKIRRRQRIFGGGWEAVMRLAVLARDGTHDLDRLETVWRNPETPTIAQAADAALKKQALGVPFAQLAEDLGYSPTQVERMREQRRQDVLDGIGLDLGDIAS